MPHTRFHYEPITPAVGNSQSAPRFNNPASSVNSFSSSFNTPSFNGARAGTNSGANFPSTNLNANFPSIDGSNFSIPTLGGSAGDFEGLNFGDTGNIKTSIGGDGSKDGTGFQLFGENGALIPGLNALAGLFDAHTARQTLKAQKEAFRFNKSLSLANLSNSARITNAEISGQASAVGRQTGLTGGALDKYIAQRLSERRVAGTV